MTSVAAEKPTEDREPIVHPIRLVQASVIADLLDCSQGTIYNLIHEQGLPAIKLGAHYRFDYDKVIEWCNNGGSLQKRDRSK